jgi:2-oxo-4-hydroxy-4-carboxy-5-ureidoimidazoline decarboxylase
MGKTRAGWHSSSLDKLEKANVDYENKFGFIYLLCATGKSASVMLDSLYERLPNDLNKEIGIAMEEQNKITKLRIEKLLS